MNNSNLLKEIGLRINKRRKELAITQEQLAEMMDVSVQMISNLELGKKAIRPENLVKVCAALNISADYILRGKRNDLDIVSYSEKYKKLPADKQELLDKLADSWLSD